MLLAIADAFRTSGTGVTEYAVWWNKVLEPEAPQHAKPTLLNSANPRFHLQIISVHTPFARLDPPNTPSR